MEIQPEFDLGRADPGFDVGRARLSGPDMFHRFRVPAEGKPLRNVKLNPTEVLILVERDGQRIAFTARQLSYHHIAQGKLNGFPYLAAFCGVCHSGMGLIPLVDSRLHNFSAGGLYDGLILLIDDESKTYWNHITGEGVHGPLSGKHLETFPLEITNVKKELERDPNLQIQISTPNMFGRFFSRFIHSKPYFDHGRFPPGFRGTMGKSDSRLPEMSSGLGVIEGRNTRFYPVKIIQGGIIDDFGGKPLKVAIDEITHVPYAVFEDKDESRPLQIFTRWYGFSYSYPDCTVYKTLN